MSASSFHFVAPIRHENLEINFLIGPSVPPDYLTLAEGCSQQLVEIFETGRVGRLAVWNKSADRPLFIQVGELLKGGLQDRTVATDLVLDPGEKFDGLQSYCVERARWSKREAEDHTKFTPSQEFVSTKPLRKRATGGSRSGLGSGQQSAIGYGFCGPGLYGIRGVTVEL